MCIMSKTAELEIEMDLIRREIKKLSFLIPTEAIKKIKLIKKYKLKEIEYKCEI